MSFRSHHRLALGGVTLLAAAGLGLAASDPLPGAPGGAKAAPGGGRPNIVLIQTDDQTYRQLTRRVMPNTKRLLAQHGTRFTDYVASTAQCCPSRASLLTGQYAHNHGVTSNNVGYPGLVDKGNVLPVWLQRAGYRTIHVGKFLNGYERSVEPDSVVAPGWDEWHSVLGNTQLLRLRPVRQRHRPASRKAARGPHHARAQPGRRAPGQEVRAQGAPLLPPARPAGATCRDSSTTPRPLRPGAHPRAGRQEAVQGRGATESTVVQRGGHERQTQLPERRRRRWDPPRDERFASTGAAPSPRSAASIAASRRSMTR